MHSVRLVINLVRFLLKRGVMNNMSTRKYKPAPQVNLPNRQWPSNTITHPPRWCSVDLRDGNQAIATPMSLNEKLDMFNLLVQMGFKEIEVGFPSASQVEYDFTRLLIEKKIVPDDVCIQVLTQAREHLIKKTFDAIRGANKVIVHLYNSTSELQRRVVFRQGKSEILNIAVQGARLIRDEAKKISGTKIFYEYSPESFTGTELEFALEISQAVMDVWQPARGNEMILNLPSTVEMATPNVYADQIEWMCRHLQNRDTLVISLHAHNDRGTAVAATELALMAGADRVEGTLFGNGERTGNVDIVTLALNLFSQGIDPKLDFHNIARIVDVYERCTKMQVHARQPYAGELVYTAFSGSHQDAINKGMKNCQDSRSSIWEVPYLPIDPTDVGKTFEAIIRINSQSGKGGIAYIMEKEFGFVLPKEMHPEFGRIIQAVSDKAGSEVPPQAILEVFEQEYLASNGPLLFKTCEIRERPVPKEKEHARVSEIKASVLVNGEESRIAGTGNGPVDAFCHAVKKELNIDFTLVSYHEHALEQGSDSLAAAYIQIEDTDNRKFFGVGIDSNISVASFKAVASAVNRSPAIRAKLTADTKGRRGQ